MHKVVITDRLQGPMLTLSIDLDSWGFAHGSLLFFLGLLGSSSMRHWLGLGFRDKGLGFRVQGLGLRVQNLESRVA